MVIRPDLISTLFSGWYDPLLQNQAYVDFATNAPGYGQLQSDKVIAKLNKAYFGEGGCRDQELACYAASIVVDFVLLGIEWHELKPSYVPSIGCTPPNAPHVGRLFVQHLVLHTILYLATTIPAIGMWHSKNRSPIMGRILRE